MRLGWGVLGVLALTQGVLGAEIISSEKVEADVQADDLLGALKDLSAIAARNGGHRASGTQGYKAALDYIINRLKGKDGKGLDVQTQCFTHLFDQTNEIKLTGPHHEAVLVISLGYNPATPKGGITAEVVDTPVDDKHGSCCVMEQWASVNATGKIALVKRGGCPVADKVILAKARGARAVILYNSEPGSSIPTASLGHNNVGKLVPVGAVTMETGVEWKSRLSAGRGPFTVTLTVDSIVEEREACNLIADTKEGDPQSVVMLGAHLDSVKDGPGMNDNASGVVALLVLALSFAKYTGLTSTVRFAFWGGEERGLLGSFHYADNLTVELSQSIQFYFNYDMIASKHPKYRVYADTDADRFGASRLQKYLTDEGKDCPFERFGVSSDYVAFLQLGIASSGIFTGGGEGSDPCYHQKCDDVDNINMDALTMNTKAAGSVAAGLALSLEGLPSREKADFMQAAGEASMNVPSDVRTCGNGDA